MSLEGSREGTGALDILGHDRALLHIGVGIVDMVSGCRRLVVLFIEAVHGGEKQEVQDNEAGGGVTVEGQVSA